MRHFAQLISAVALVVCLITAPGAATALTQSAVEQGEQIFASNCAACHMGGGNVIQASRTLKIGDLMGTVIVPFMKLETEEDYETITEIAENTIDFWAENGLEHERCGEMIERIGLVNFLEGIDIEVDPHMIADARQLSLIHI